MWKIICVKHHPTHLLLHRLILVGLRWTPQIWHHNFHNSGGKLIAPVCRPTFLGCHQVLCGYDAFQCLLPLLLWTLVVVQISHSLSPKWWTISEVATVTVMKCHTLSILSTRLSLDSHLSVCQKAFADIVFTVLDWTGQSSLTASALLYTWMLYMYDYMYWYMYLIVQQHFLCVQIKMTSYPFLKPGVIHHYCMTQLGSQRKLYTPLYCFLVISCALEHSAIHMVPRWFMVEGHSEYP